jgi:hypothetical protein
MGCPWDTSTARMVMQAPYHVYNARKTVRPATKNFWYAEPQLRPVNISHPLLATVPNHFPRAA